MDPNSLHYVMLKVSKIKNSEDEQELGLKKGAEKYLLQIIDMNNKVLYNEA